MKSKQFKSDFLVIGSGIAGLAFAIKASRFGTVNIVTKKKDFDSNTNYAQGGIASVLAPEDSFEKHIEDTLKAGAGLGNRTAVEILVREGPDRIRELMEWGTQFSEREGSGGKGARPRTGGRPFDEPHRARARPDRQGGGARPPEKSIRDKKHPPVRRPHGRRPPHRAPARDKGQKTGNRSTATAPISSTTPAAW